MATARPPTTIKAAFHGAAVKAAAAGCEEVLETVPGAVEPPDGVVTVALELPPFLVVTVEFAKLDVSPEVGDIVGTG